MAKQTIDIQQSAGENASRMNGNFGELYDGVSTLSQKATGLEERVTELEENPSSGGGMDISDIAGECEELTVELIQGYRIDPYGGGLIGAPGNLDTCITAPIPSTGRVGKFLYYPGKYGWGAVYRRYSIENEITKVSASPSPEMYGNNPHVIVPILDENEFTQIRVTTFDSTAKVYVVTKHWLQCRNLCTDWAGKKWAMLGDSYVAGQNIHETWHKIFSTRHYAGFKQLGHGGYGLVSSGNYSSSSLLSQLTTDLLDGNGEPLDIDIIGVCCGRNDYSNGVPIGDIDDMITEVGTNPNFPASYSGDVTFMGGMNYICKWLLDNYAGKTIFFVTPWYFLNDNPTGNAIEPQYKYIDAVMEVAGKWGIPCFDAARQSGISVQHDGFRTKYFLSSKDTSHLNANGHRIMARGPVCGWLENLFRE